MQLKLFLKNKQFLSLTGNIVMALLNIVTTAILYRSMARADIGTWFFFLVTFNLADTFRTGLLQTAFIKFYSGAEKSLAENILGSTWYLGLLVTGLVFLVSLIGRLYFGFFQNANMCIVTSWMGITFLSTMPIVVATWVLQAEQRYQEILYIRLVNQLSFLIFVLLWIFYRKIDLTFVFTANLASCILTVALVFSFRWAKIKTITKKTAQSVKQIYHFGKYSLGTSISSNLLKSSDVFVINFALGPSSVAVYNLAQSLMNIIDIPLRSFLATALPLLSVAQNKGVKKDVEYIFKKYAGVLTLVFIPFAIGAIIFADVAVSIIGGHKYADTPAANIFRIFMTFAIFFSLDKFTGLTLDVINKPKLNFYKVLIMLVINVAGDFAGIYFTHSLYGVGIASIPTFVIGTLLGYWFLKKFLNFNLNEIIRVGYSEIISIVKRVSNKV